MICGLAMELRGKLAVRDGVEDPMKFVGGSVRQQGITPIESIFSIACGCDEGPSKYMGLSVYYLRSVVCINSVSLGLADYKRSLPYTSRGICHADGGAEGGADDELGYGVIPHRERA